MNPNKVGPFAAPTFTVKSSAVGFGSEISTKHTGIRRPYSATAVPDFRGIQRADPRTASANSAIG